MTRQPARNRRAHPTARADGGGMSWAVSNCWATISASAPRRIATCRSSRRRGRRRTRAGRRTRSRGRRTRPLRGRRPRSSSPPGRRGARGASRRSRRRSRRRRSALPRERTCGPDSCDRSCADRGRRRGTDGVKCPSRPRRGRTPLPPAVRGSRDRSGRRRSRRTSPWRGRRRRRCRDRRRSRSGRPSARGLSRASSRRFWPYASSADGSISSTSAEPFASQSCRM